MKGYLSLVLHAHLPFVRHPEHEDFLEEDWLYEAISETYLPLLRLFARRLDRLCELAEKEVRRTEKDATFAPVTRFYREHFGTLRSAFHDRYRGDLVAAFRRLQDAGHV